MTYRIAAPGGTWDVADDGLYTVSQNANQVSDSVGNARPVGAIGTFNATTAFAYMSGSALDVQFDGTTTPITLGTSGSDITATKGGTTLTFSGIASINALGTSGSDNLEIDGSIGSPLAFVDGNGNEFVRLLSGSYTFASDLSSLQNVTVTIDDGASAIFATSQHLANLIVDGSATLENTLFTNAISVAGKLDVGNNALFIDYSGAGQLGSATGGVYDGITGLVQSGRSDGSWTGNGIITGMSAAAGSNPLTTLGVAEASDALGISGAQTALWDGQPVDATTVLVKYTYVGDANLDGIINGDDYFAIDAGFSAQSSGYAQGDFDYNGRIDADDYFAIDSHYGKATTALAASPAIVNNSASIFSDTSIPSAYDRLMAADELL